MKLKISTKLPLNSELEQTMPQSKAVLFSWNLESDFPNQADVLVYRAANVFDDRFHLIEQGEAVESVLVLQLALAQQWMYCRKEEGSLESASCRAASMIKTALLKHGTYLYMYRINGELKVNSNEKMTRLATKRLVNYVDVRQDVAVQSFQDVGQQKFTQPSSSLNGRTETINSKTELLKAYAAVKDMYHVNIAMNRVSPFERAIWNRVEKEMAAKINLNGE